MQVFIRAREKQKSAQKKGFRLVTLLILHNEGSTSRTSPCHVGRDERGLPRETIITR